MSKIIDYEKVQILTADNVFLLDGNHGTKTILAHDLANALLAMMTSKEQVAKLNMSELDQITALAATDKVMIGTSAGVRAVSASDALFGILDACISVEQRRNIFRGKSLGAAFTAAQKNEIKANTFKGMFLGDYWEIGGHIWRIVDFNYWLNSGDASCSTPHLVIMPDAQLYAAQMNESNVTTGGYVGSKMYTEHLANAKTIVNSAFGSSNVLNHRTLLVNAVTNGQPSGGSWYDSTVELPNEIMMYGCHVFTPSNDGTNIPYLYTIDKTQLALMQMYPRFINPHRNWYWLRDVVSGAFFAYVDGGGSPDYHNASASGGVRPVFGVVG